MPLSKIFSFDNGISFNLLLVINLPLNSYKRAFGFSQLITPLKLFKSVSSLKHGKSDGTYLIFKFVSPSKLDVFT